MEADAQRVEALGPAERIIQTLTTYTDHAVHNRPGVVFEDRRQPYGVRWQQATWKKEGDLKVVYLLQKVGRMNRRTRLGVGQPGSDRVVEGGRTVARFRNPGLFPEVVAHIYGQIAEVWKVDNEFAAKWASWAFNNENSRDLKVILAAFMLVQSRFGEPVKDGDDSFFDEDYRAVGEAMCLLHNKKPGHTFNPKLLLRIGDVLSLPQVAEINRRLGFGQTARRAIVGRYDKVIEKWLRHMEMNPKLLEKLIKGEGFRSKIMALCRRVKYKPQTERFFEILSWDQVQAKDGHREVAVGKKTKKAESWEGLTEEQVCEKIEAEKPGWKVIAGKLPKDVGVTPAIMTAAIMYGCLSDADLIIMTPTLEELGLLTGIEREGSVLARWKAATERAENQRAANIARNVRTEEAKKGLEEASDKAAQKAVEEVTRDMRIYVFVDKSSSMSGAIERAKEHLKKFVGAFPLERLHVSVFNTVGREVEIKAPTSAAVAQAFRGHTAGGGTSYANGVACLVAKYKPTHEEDALFIFVGDQEDHNAQGIVDVVRHYGVNPVAFGMLHVVSHQWGGMGGNVVETAAAALRIPCFRIDEKIFDDPYAVTRTFRNLISTTPVGQKAATHAAPKRVSLVDAILKTPLLQKPAWA
jgi:hypothetical protein